MAAMREGKLSSERIVSAFCRRARSIGNHKTRSVAQEFYDEAIQTAVLTDESVHGQTGNGSPSSGDGPRVLEGMPVSIKDNLHMKGAVSTQPASQYFFFLFL